MREIYKSGRSMSHLQTMEGSKNKLGILKAFTVLSKIGLEDSLVMVIISYLCVHRLRLLHKMHT